MELNLVVKYPVMFPSWVYNYGYGDLKKQVTIENDMTSVTFILQEDETIYNSPLWRYADGSQRNAAKYRCRSCEEMSEVWISDIFLCDKHIPDRIEKQLSDHVEQHLKLGAWGIHVYKNTKGIK